MTILYAALIPIFIAYFALPSNFFYTKYGTSKDTELGGLGYSADATDIRKKYHAINEMGIILNKVDGYEFATRSRQADANRAEQFVNVLASNVKGSLNQKVNGVSGIEVITSGPNEAAHKFSQALNSEVKNQNAIDNFDENMNDQRNVKNIKTE